MIERAPVVGGVTGAFAQLATVGPRNGTGSVSYADTSVVTGETYAYRVAAVNGVGASAYSNIVTQALVPPAAPSNVGAAANRQGNRERVTLTWIDNANNETGFIIQWATNAAFTQGLQTATVGANVTTYRTGNINRTAYYFRIAATNLAGTSAWVVATPAPVPAP